MSSVASKVTAQGQISVPAEVRRKLGIGPGSTLQWETRGNHVVVRRAGKYSAEELHRALFGERHPRRKTLAELERGLRDAVRKRHARG